MADAADGAGNLVQAAGIAKTPADFLKAIKGKAVLVKLNSGVDYRGELSFWRIFLFHSYRAPRSLMQGV